MKKIYIILQNGQVFEGRSFGAEGHVVGEIVFSTGMVGYLEALTDPVYHGQILVSTFPLIGNYGVIPEDLESDKIHVSAYVVREWAQNPSNYRCGGDIDTWLKENGVVGICGVDTRALTEAIREYGVMNAIITDTLPDPIVPDEVITYSVKNGISAVTCEEPKFFPTQDAKYNVAVYDFGVTNSVIKALNSRGCNVAILPATTPASIVLEGNYDGVVLSNGPSGDPRENVEIILEIRKLLGALPIFAMGLGHQLLARAAGAGTTKLKFGHHGANQPVKNTETGKVEITSQAHLYTVNPARLPANATITETNVLDGSIEAIEYREQMAFTVQYYPSDIHFDKFVELMKK
ncbi:MAG: glutamine-hydrolyzing carbamoyl-phosphate synthase small subunit [Ruminococcaceae bacterium]|nr:glutamine-hydrolyzing carbamoyl-phosphate synthase small subunit [Oscillospiraceae bacterium]